MSVAPAVHGRRESGAQQEAPGDAREGVALAAQPEEERDPVEEPVSRVEGREEERRLLHLTWTEAAIWQVLRGRVGEVVPRRELCGLVFGPLPFGASRMDVTYDTQRLTVHLHNLRAKCRDAGIEIRSYPGEGVRLDVLPPGVAAYQRHRGRPVTWRIVGWPDGPEMVGFDPHEQLGTQNGEPR